MLKLALHYEAEYLSKLTSQIDSKLASKIELLHICDSTICAAESIFMRETGLN